MSSSEQHLSTTAPRPDGDQMSELGRILVDQGVLTAEELDRAREHSAADGRSLAQSLVQLGLAGEKDLVRALAARLHMPFVEVGPDTVEESAARLLPRSVAEAHTALPVAFADDGDGLVVAIADPNNTAAKDAVEGVTGLPAQLALTTRRALREAIRHLAGDDRPGEDGSPDRTARPSATRSPRRSLDSVEFGPRVQFEERTAVDLDELLIELLERGGSDLHLTTGIPPTIRVHGDLTPLRSYPELNSDELQKMLYAIMTQKQREQFENELELDMSYSIPGRARYRVNVFQQRDSLGAVMRIIPFEIYGLDELGIPSQVGNFAYLPRGFVLVTGPTGSGKSTTLASLINLINENRPVHIMTVEDPIEFLHNHKRAVVNQREVGSDTHSFAAALKHVLRQDPDVILVGELRDLETIQIALTAAETGHLVFGTLHTQDAPQTIDRIIDVFPPHQQEQIRVQLAGAIQGVVSQTLMKRADGEGRVVATEVMVATSGIRNLVREGKTHQIYSSIQAGGQHGMEALDQSLARLVKTGQVTYEVASEKCANLAEFNRLVGRGSG